MAIYFHWEQATLDLWRSAFTDAGISAEIQREGTLGNPADIEFAVVWAPPPGRLAEFNNLRYIFSIGAGVTHITLDEAAPLHIPIVRLQDDNLVLDMSCHVIHWVLHFHRYYYQYRLYQSEKRWLRHRYPENSQCRVAVLGLGQTGLDACRRLRDLGFAVTGWSRSKKTVDGVQCLHGPGSWPQVLADADILVNLLPLTDATTDLINAQALNQLPDGAFIINCSRGGTITDTDLLAALDSGKIEAAALDVFRDEPLPENNPYWTHPKVSVTPHAAAPTNEASAARFIAGHIRRALAGEEPWPIVNLERGY